MKLTAYSDKREVLHLVKLLANVEASERCNDTACSKLAWNVRNWSRENMAITCNKH